MPLLGRLPIPFRGSDGILRHAIAGIIRQAELELRRIIIPLLGRLPIPLHGLDGIFRHADAVGIRHAEIILRVDIPLLGRLAQRVGGLIGQTGQ